MKVFLKCLSFEPVIV